MQEASSSAPSPSNHVPYDIIPYTDENDLPIIMDMMERELSEPYSVRLRDGDKKCIGSIVCKLDKSKHDTMKGYIAMVAVERPYRKLGIGSALVSTTIKRMIQDGCDEVVLETEITNTGSLALYASLGFMKTKRLKRYYLNGVDAFALCLPLTSK